MREPRTPAEIAVAFIQAFARRDLAAVAALLADDVVLESPQVRLTGAPAVARAIGDFAQVVDGVDNLTAVGDGNRAMVMYDMRTTPYGTLRTVDHIEVRDGRIVSDILVFDTYPVRTATRPSATSG